MAPCGVGNTRGAYLFAMALSWVGLRTRVGVPRGGTKVDGELGVLSV